MQDFLGIDDNVIPEEYRMLREQLQRFVREEVTPVADQWEEDGRIPRSLFERMGELGFLGLSFPEQYGGSGMSNFAGLILNEELARSGYGGLTASLTVQSDMSALHLARVGSEEQKQKYLPDVIAGKLICSLGVTEPRGGSDLTRIATTARRDGDDYILNGAKLFITNANIADLFFVVAKTDPEAQGGRGFSLFVVERETPGFSNGQKFKKTGWHSSDTGELRFDDCRVPAANLIGEEGKGFIYMFLGLDHERLCAAGQALGLMDAAIDSTLEWTRSREAYGKTLWDLQAIRHEMARATNEYLAARSLTYLVAAKATRGESIQMEGAMLKAHVPAVGDRILYKCVQFHGGMGFMSETPVERMSRDIRNLAIGGGATEVMLDEVAKRI